MAGHPARIEVFDCKKSAIKGKPFLHQVPFTNVRTVVKLELLGKQGTVITTQERERFSFSSSDANNKELLGYCKLLYELPDIIIPETPKRCLVLQKHIEQFKDPKKYDASKFFVISSTICVKTMYTH